MQSRMDVVNGYFLVTKVDDQGERKFELLDCDSSEKVFTSNNQAECVEVASVLSAIQEVVATVGDAIPVADQIALTLNRSLESRGIVVEDEPEEPQAPEQVAPAPVKSRPPAPEPVEVAAPPEE